MKKFALFLGLTILNGLAAAQVTFIINSLPEDTPEGSVFYMASTHNHWAPNHESFKFEYDELGRLSLILFELPDTMEYKICRGTRNSVEVDSLGADINPRIYADSLGRSIPISISNWRDRMAPKQLKSTATSNVFFTPTSIEIPQLKRRRTVRVYFPPNYSSKQGFPVIYMFDGQNAFDRSTAFANEWRIDETLDSLHYTRRFGAIVVAIYHDDDERTNEYSPWPNEDKQGGDGAKMVRFIVRNLKPYIDKYYRTLPDADNTMIMGSGMGGLMALYTAMEYPKVFSKVGLFSPTLDWSDEVFKRLEKFKSKDFQQYYMVAGEQEEEHVISNLEEVHKLLLEAGFSEEDELRLEIDPKGRHSEWFWGGKFPDAVKWLFDI